jgi:hypothetical protein
MNLSFSHALNSSIPHIEQKGIGFETPTNNFGYHVASSFHNRMAKLFLGLHKASIKYTLYSITGHLVSFIKNQNKLHVYITNKDI